jgi:hypothetical protein
MRQVLRAGEPGPGWLFARDTYIYSSPNGCLPRSAELTRGNWIPHRRPLDFVARYSSHAAALSFLFESGDVDILHARLRVSIPRSFATNALRPVHYPNMTRMSGDVKVSSSESICYSWTFISCILYLKNV